MLLYLLDLSSFVSSSIPPVTANLNYSWSSCPAVISPPPVCFLCYWSPKWWCSYYLLVYRKKVLELIFHNVLTGGKKVSLPLHIQVGNAVSLVLCDHRQYPDWLEHHYFWQGHYKVLQFACAQLRGYIDFAILFLIHIKRFPQRYHLLKIIQICEPKWTVS